MDTGVKSLAQLSEEGKEKKYISIEIGSKVSGYTKDYLERLCRLRKIEYMLRADGAYAPELESLLRETHTILLSYEGVSFIDKASLVEPTPETPNTSFVSTALHEVQSVVADPELGPLTLEPASVTTADLAEESKEPFAQPIPRFGDMNHLSQQAFGGNPFSFVGRPVVSDGTKQEAEPEQEVHVPIGTGASPAAVSTEPVHAATHIPIVAPHEEEERIAITPPAPPAEVHVAPTHLAIEIDRKEPMPHTHIAAPAVVDLSRPAVVPHKSIPIKLEVSHEDTHEKDEWDKLLFGHGTQAFPQQAAPDVSPVIPVAATPSVYHPIHTEVDPAAHRDDAPLFPTIAKEGVIREVSRAIPDSFTPPQGQRVVVFDPGLKTVAGSSSERASAPLIPRAVPTEQPIPMVQVPEASAPTQPRSLSPRQPLSPTPRTPVAAMRVMPHALITEPEHALSIPAQHALLVPKRAQLVLASVMAIGMFLVGGTVLSERFNLDLNASSYTAAVGAVGASSDPARNDQPAPSAVLPFSNEIIVATDTPQDVLEVTPVFLNGTGTTYEYRIP